MLGKMQGGAPLFRRPRLASLSKRELGQPGIQPASGNDPCEGTNRFRI
jgi:hypothetical protein